MKRSKLWRGLAVCFAAAGSMFAAAGSAWADGNVNRVYVFNGGATGADGLPAGTPGNPFNNNANGLIFQQMGLLGANGAPPTVNGNNVQQGGNNVGTVIRDGNNNIIGYQSADGKSRAYNLDAGATMAQAWNAVANGGTVTIDKHGQTDGGGITLDGGGMYDGFTPAGGGGAGTGAGNPLGPYPLPPRPGAGITLNSNGCDTAVDPDGEDPGTSVSGSGAGVPGVGASNGNGDTIYKNCNWRIVGTPAQVAAGTAKLEACAKKAGFKKKNGSGDVGAWIASLPMKDQLQAMIDCLGAGAATPSISYTKTPNGGCGGGVPPVGEGNGCYYTPVRVVTPSGGTIHYEQDIDHNTIDLLMPPGVQPPRVPILLTADVLDESLFPPGTEPATYVVGVHAYGPYPNPQFPNPSQLHFTYPTSVTPIGLFRVLPNGNLQPHPGSVGGGQVMTQIQQGGQYVLLMNSPPPTAAVPTMSEWGLIALGSGVLIFGVMMVRRRLA